MANVTYFEQVFIANKAGTLNDQSQYVFNAELKRGFDDTDLTTFSTGGNPIAETHVPGAINPQLPMKVFLDPVICKAIRQLDNLIGFTVMAVEGQNAVPGRGDRCWRQSCAVPQFQVTVNVGQPMTVDFTPEAADLTGGIIPDWYPY